MLEVLERKLAAIHVHGITATHVRGFGTHPNLFADDWATEHTKIEILRAGEDVDALVTTIMDIAHVGAVGDGVVAVLPVDKFFRIRTRSEATP